MGFVGHGNSGGKGGKQDAASAEHGFSPCFVIWQWRRDSITSARQPLRFAA
ncbi:hypothetical protein BF49_1662 [Bradyrhizobium sp.]|nr:hypothetical protein BF49_1662 [Bradyrhizobium sp.]